MNLFQSFRSQIADIILETSRAGKLPEGLDTSRITVEPPRDASHGDITTNAAMVLAKPCKMKPRDIAEILAKELESLDAVEKLDIAGPGFINMTLASGYWYDRLKDVLKAGPEYGQSDMGNGEKVNVEYVSANPTGPMHVGHARGAVVGDVLASLLAKAGYDVTREYYINDAGAQVDVLARSLHLRYREALGDNIGEIPEGLYPGDYLIGAGKALADRDGNKWQNVDEADWLAPVREFAINAMMDLIRDDLKAAGVKHDLFSSERALVEAGGVDGVLKFLEEKDLVYVGVLEPPKGKLPDDWEARPQTLFKASDFGDDVDRALKKSDGTWTYFATDMAYHLDKFKRGFKTMINVWGADHGGYVKRLDAAIKAMTDGEGEMDVKLCQMVNLLDGGEPVKMSKRAGTFVTLRDVIDRVGKDVVRFIMLTRKNDAHLDFDFQKVMEQSKDNPVFYVQYANARICSAFKKAKEEKGFNALSDEDLLGADLSILSDDGELALIRELATWPRAVEAAAESHEPHRIAYFLSDLAASFHSLYNAGNDRAELRFVLDDEETTKARLALIRAVQMVIASGLGIMGVTPVEEMR